jgi:hypothetical protein
VIGNADVREDNEWHHLLIQRRDARKAAAKAKAAQQLTMASTLLFFI